MKKLKLLIIDDEVVDRAFYQRMLRQSFEVPYEAVEAKSGEEGLKAFDQNNVDCILLDYQLPDTTGVDLLKKLKKKGKFVPVIMLTGRGDEDIAVTAMKEGATDYIIKNKIDPGQLIKTILNAIRNSQLKKIIHQQKKQLKYYAFYDNLTGLANRHTFEEMTTRALAEAKRLNHSLAVIFIDLDNFVSINDALGHLAGDELLIEVGHRLKYVLPKDTIIARLGDDEFAVLLTQMTMDNYAAIARRILEKISEPYQLSIDRAKVGASIGIACYPGTSDNTNELLKQATIALGRAKGAGHGHFKFYSEEMDKIYQVESKLELALHDAIQEGHEFCLAYQPIFELKTKKLMGIEVVLQWQHPEHGLIRPDQFISIAEKSGMTVILAKWIVDHFTQTLMQVENQSVLNHLFFTIKIDLSLRQLSNYLLSDSIANLLAQTNLRSAQIAFEINEETIFEYFEDLSFLKNMQELSLCLLIHDFRLVYSALGELIKLPIRFLKIDTNLIEKINETQYSTSVINAIINLGKNMNLTIIASGVKDKTQLQFLTKEECHAAQGNYFSELLTSEQLNAFLNRN